MIFVWTVDVVTATVSGSAWRRVHCENCRKDFAFRIERTVSWTVEISSDVDKQTAADRAKAGVESELRRALEREVVPVPCPNCGWYQRDMHPILRERLSSSAKTAAILTIMLGLGTLFCAMLVLPLIATNFLDIALPLAVPLLVVVLGVRFLRKHHRLREMYNPNEEIPHHKRLARGRRRAVLVEPEPARDAGTPPQAPTTTP